MKSSYFVYQFAREIRSLTAIFNADDNISAEKVFNGIDKLTKGHYEYCLEKGWISFSRNDYYILKKLSLRIDARENLVRILEN